MHAQPDIGSLGPALGVRHTAACGGLPRWEGGSTVRWFECLAAVAAGVAWASVWVDA